jgi:hypothetical protein
MGKSGLIERKVQCISVLCGSEERSMGLVCAGGSPVAVMPILSVGGTAI